MFNTIDEMLAVLTSYRTKYNRYNELSAKLDGVKSPRLTDEAISTVPTSQEHRYNQNIEERDELTKEMRQIEDVIISIKSVDYLSFVILWDKFIEFETLEEISFSHPKRSSRCGQSGGILIKFPFCPHSAFW